MIGTSFPLEKVLFVTFSLLLLIQYHYKSKCIMDVESKNKFTIMEVEPSFELLGPSNITFPSMEEDNQLFDIKNFTYLLNPPVCKNYTEGLLLLIIVSSKPSHTKLRELIRTTWGNQTASTKLVFLMGIPPIEDVLKDNTTLSEQIHKESILYGDIVQGTFLDAYRNLTYKHVMGLKWAAHSCAAARYVLKSDDDVMIHSRALRNFLIRDLSPWGAMKLILCQVVAGGVVLRNTTKWIVTKEEYEDDVYPNYCTGRFILYSQDVVRHLVEASRNAKFFWIDDVMVTGILAESIKVQRSDIHTLALTNERSRIFRTMEPERAGRFILVDDPLDYNETFQVMGKIYKAALNINSSDIRT